MVLLCKANKKSSIKENIFENRFMHVAEFKEWVQKFHIKNNKALLKEILIFIGAELMSSDLRASVSLI